MKSSSSFPTDAHRARPSSSINCLSKSARPPCRPDDCGRGSRPRRSPRPSIQSQGTLRSKKESPTANPIHSTNQHRYVPKPITMNRLRSLHAAPASTSTRGRRRSVGSREHRAELGPRRCTSRDALRRPRPFISLRDLNAMPLIEPPLSYGYDHSQQRPTMSAWPSCDCRYDVSLESTTTSVRPSTWTDASYCEPSIL
jgi:hypothetical protein